jgi:hypothetical protein
MAAIRLAMFERIVCTDSPVKALSEHASTGPWLIVRTRKAAFRSGLL